MSPDSLCVAPFEELAPASFDIPANACDTHAHVISADTSRFPLSPIRSYTPVPATEDQYLAMLDAQGMTYGVLVQVSVYGTDNRYMLDVLGRHRDRLRGVAVIDPHVSDAELDAMHAAGVRGVRVNVLFKGGVGLHEVNRIADRIKELGWHMQFLVDARQLPELLPVMRRLPVVGVLDHMGHMPVSEGNASPGYQAMLHLLTDYGWWVKLSGAYRISNDENRFGDTIQRAQGLVEAAPDRCLWGSDWPHVAIPKMVDTGELRNQLAQWIPDEATRHRILVHNPAALYGF